MEYMIKKAKAEDEKIIKLRNNNEKLDLFKFVLSYSIG